ncbi:MAG: phosphonoacetate hydrolase [Gammaproteobacteria bacterium]|nr:phosphonoacetate hydrolase [Gammaproteobacteria bacterium]
MSERDTIRVNGREYRSPDRPVVVLCVDGCEPDYAQSDGGGYLERAMAAQRMPYLSRALAQGTRRLADCVIPSFTNPNNLSIVTGVPPRDHGICGNFYLDPDSGEAVMMNDAALLRVPTILEAFSQAGARIAVVTAKDKLRALLGKGLCHDRGKDVCFSAERSAEASLNDNGIGDVPAWLQREVPSVYSAALSEFVLAAGVALLEQQRPDIIYLSTTDYIQHKHPPGSAVANDFCAMLDDHLARMDASGAIIALTADHGMKAKHDAGGKAQIVFLQSLLDERLGAGRARVILPITDPYVVHHGALGSFACVYLQPDLDVDEVMDLLEDQPGLDLMLARDDAAIHFDLAEDRIGDFIVVSTPHHVIGSTPEQHDLSALDAPLRSHGGTSEQKVPLFLNRPTPDLPPDRRLRNYDVFDVALNHAR